MLAQEYLTRWKKTLIVVSHDRDFLNTVTTDIVHLHDQQLHGYRGNFAQFEDMYEQKRREVNKVADKFEKQMKAAKRAGSRDKQDKVSSPGSVQHMMATTPWVTHSKSPRLSQSAGLCWLCLHLSAPFRSAARHPSKLCRQQPVSTLEEFQNGASPSGHCPAQGLGRRQLCS